MKTGFKDPAKPKKHEPPAQPVNGKNSPWDFRCPEYDQRSSYFVNAGTDYGTGVNQPIGHPGNPKMTVPALPKGRVDTAERCKDF